VTTPDYRNQRKGRRGIEMRNTYRSFFRFVLPVAVVVAILVAAAPVNAQAILKVNDNVNFRFGLLLQAWADWQQLSDTNGNTAGYQQNLFIRRARFLFAGNLAKDVSFFLDTENTNLGKSPKNTTGTQLGTGFQLLDFYGEWKIATEFQLQGGLILIPLCRNCNESAASQLTLDYGSFSFLESAATGSTIGRDTGFQVKGYLLDGRLEYRAGAYQGVRQTGSKNAFRFTGRLAYNFFEKEQVQFYTGTYLAAKKVLAIGTGYDTQSNYRAYAFDGFLNLPFGKNALTVEIDYINYDGGTTFTTLYKQNTFMGQAGFYFGVPKLMPFFRYEEESFTDTVRKVGNQRNIQAGLTYYPFGQNYKITGAWTRRQRPDDPKTATTSEFTIQMQVFYF
jgi:hypothetical protein